MDTRQASSHGVIEIGPLPLDRRLEKAAKPIRRGSAVARGRVRVRAVAAPQYRRGGATGGVGGVLGALGRDHEGSGHVGGVHVP